MRIAIVILLLPALAHAATYDVGPGQTYTNIGDVPWPTIAAGDTVNIHARPTPYAEKFIVNATGTASAPILIQGIPDSSGALPILDGANAIEATNETGFQDDTRFIIKIGDANTPSNPNGGAYITIQGLHIRNANPSYTFTSNHEGSGVAYDQNASGIWLQHGDHLTVRGCELENNGNGIFGAWGSASPVSNVLIEGNYLHDNGIPNDAYEHNSYIQVDTITYQYNWYAPPCPTCQGNNLKDRSSNMVARFNWIEGGERVMDLVDNSNAQLVSEPGYATAYVYGNILVKTDSAGNNALVHFGGDSGTTANYRTTLWFWNNTVVSTRTGHTYLFQLDTSSQTANVVNNAIANAVGPPPQILASSGVATFDHNWITTGYAQGGTVTETGTLTGTDPGFVDLANGDYHLASGSPCIDAAGALDSALAAYPLDHEYLAPQQGIARENDGTLDLGAYEYGTPVSTSTTTSSTGTTTATSTTSSASSTATSTAGSTGTSTSTTTSTGTTTAGSTSAGSTSTGTSSSSSTTASAAASGSSGSTGSPGVKGGCGCSSGADLGLLAFGALLLVRRRH
ncbi:MAG: polysaccharide-degrading enzyme [Deltaproteobacteria bacterium]|nr:polysaccharide-degrading enzyme [Deltaproteobacteria bacterium]